MSIIISKELPYFKSKKHLSLAEPPRFEKVSSQRVKKIALLNLMPLKQKTEMDFVSFLDKFEEDIQLSFLFFRSYSPKNTSKKYLKKFYQFWDEAINSIDGIILSGSPIEHLDFEKVYYWKEFQCLIKKISLMKIPSIFICWSAQAALYQLYKIEKVLKKEKSFGFFPLKHKENVFIPVSRYAESKQEVLRSSSQLEILTETSASGISAIRDLRNPFFYLFDHYEYPKRRLEEEFQRDKNLKNNLPPQNSTNKKIKSALWQNFALKFYEEAFSLSRRKGL